MTHDDAVAWQKRLIHGTLPEICLNLRRVTVKGEDSWPDEHLAEMVLMLQARLDTWVQPSDAIDDHVRGMVQHAVWLGRAAEAERLTEQSS